MAVNVDVTPAKLKLEDGVLVTPTVFASTTNDEVTNLNITPSSASRKLVVVINENNASSGATMKVNCEAGSFWAGKALEETDVEVSTSKAFVFESAKHYGNVGLVTEPAIPDEARIRVSVTPGSSKSLATNHGATWQVFELP